MAQYRPKFRGYSRAVPLGPDYIEQQILQTYVQLALMPDHADGSRRAILARVGALEVRLTEMPQPENTLSDRPPFWLEVYCHATGTTVDRCSCFEFDEAELATAVDLVCAATGVGS